MTRPNRSRKTRAALVAVLLLAAGPPSAVAQAAAPADSSGFNAKNAWVFKLTVSIWMRQMRDNRVGIRFRTTGTFAIQKFEDLSEFSLESVNVGSIVPGVEFLIPLSDRSLLRPYLDVGAGSTNRDVLGSGFVLGSGIRGEFVFPWHRFALGVQPRLTFAITRFNEGDALDDEFTSLYLRLNARYPAWFMMGRFLPEFGIFFEPSYSGRDLTFSSLAGLGTDVGYEFQLGANFGFRGHYPKVWFFTIPRLGFGYRWGDGVNGWVIQFGGDRVTRLKWDDVPGSGGWGSNYYKYQDGE